MKKTIKLLSFVFLLVFVNNVHTQSSIYAEGLGHGFLYSINYDHRLGDSPDGLGFKIGVSYIPINNSDLLAIPTTINYLFGQGPHYFEVAGGISFLKGKANFFGDYDFESLNIAAIGNIGYRYQKSSGLVFRIGLTPILTGEIIAPYWAGVSLGYTI